MAPILSPLRRRTALFLSRGFGVALLLIASRATAEPVIPPAAPPAHEALPPLPPPAEAPPGAPSVGAPTPPPPPTTVAPIAVALPPLQAERRAEPPPAMEPGAGVLSDHQSVVHHIAVGYFGISQLPVGVGTNGTGPGIVNAPVVGVRYWATRLIGVDLGVGFGYSHTGSTTTGGMSVAGNDWGFAFHAGLPLSLASSRHFSFELVPVEATVGFAGGSSPNAGGPGAAGSVSSLSGFRMDVGGRIGAELHFGFIGIPQLALEGSIGLYVQYEAYSATATPESGAPPGSSPTTTSGTATSITTSVGSDPWAIFTDTISALYYF